MQKNNPGEKIPYKLLPGDMLVVEANGEGFFEVFPAVNGMPPNGWPSEPYAPYEADGGETDYEEEETDEEDE
jgi:hypothetical protein